MKNKFFIVATLLAILSFFAVPYTFAATNVVNDVRNFVKNFNVILFKCTNIEYHKETGKVSKLIFEQIEK